MKKNKIFRDLLLGSLLILLCLGFWLWGNLSKRNGSEAVLTYGEEQILKMPLSKNKLYTVQSHGFRVQIEVKDGRAAFVHSECPDKLCEHYGWLSREEDLAVCLPARASLTIHE